jgi:hypothetical protein
MTCSHPTSRTIPVPVVREFLRALGVVTCPSCHAVLRIHGRSRVVELDEYRRLP